MARPAEHHRSISALVLAAGLSRRMGAFKPLMTLGGRTVLHRVVGMLEAAGIADIIVVTGNRTAEVQRALGTSGVRRVENSAFRQGMFTSVKAGIKALPSGCRAFLVLPVDIPLVRPATVNRLIAASAACGDSHIFYPVYDAQRGHPPLIPSHLTPGILQWSGPEGLRGFLDRRDDEAMDVPVGDEGILLDLDTPEDHRRMSARIHRGAVPTPGECRELLTRVHSLPDHIVRHGEIVAAVAAAIYHAVQTRHSHLDADLIGAAALLHDVARLGPSHAQTGAQWLDTEGFPRVARIVRQHMDLAEDPDHPLSEAQIVYLADKLVCGDVPMALDRRFEIRQDETGDDPRARVAMERRYENACSVRDKVEQAAGCSLEAMMQTAGLALEGAQ